MRPAGISLPITQLMVWSEHLLKKCQKLSGRASWGHQNAASTHSSSLLGQEQDGGVLAGLEGT